MNNQVYLKILMIFNNANNLQIKLEYLFKDIILVLIISFLQFYDIFNFYHYYLILFPTKVIYLL